MFIGLLRLLLVLGAILLARRVVMGIFRGASGARDDRMRNPHPRRGSRPDPPPDEPQVGPQQPIEEADYEDLD